MNDLRLAATARSNLHEEIPAGKIDRLSISPSDERQLSGGRLDCEGFARAEGGVPRA